MHSDDADEAAQFGCERDLLPKVRVNVSVNKFAKETGDHRDLDDSNQQANGVVMLQLAHRDFELFNILFEIDQENL